jgi:hypothetical protein
VSSVTISSLPTASLSAVSQNDVLPIVLNATTQSATVAQIVAASKIQFPIDVPPALPTVYDDEFTGTSIDAKWTQVNFRTNATTWTIGSGYLVATDVNQGNDVFNGLMQSAPSGPWEITASIATMSPVFQNYTFPAGILVAGGLTENDPVHSLLFATWTGGDAHLVNQDATWTSVQNGNQFTAAHFGRGYVRCSWDGTSFSWSWSPDGLGWILLKSGPPGFTPAYFGIGSDVNVPGGAGNTMATYAWFRQTA